MKPNWEFLTVTEVLEIHRFVMAEFGGDAGILNEGLLESAIAMPMASFEGRLLHEDGAAIAAAYLFYICRNHPFLDGNKRTALTAAGIFLMGNKMRIKATQKELEHVTLGIAEGRISKDEVVAFFRRHTAPST